MIKGLEPGIFISGPHLMQDVMEENGTIAKTVQEELKIPVVTAMYVENPGADMFKKDVYIVETSDSAADEKSITCIGKLAKKLAKGEEILTCRRRFA